MGTIAPSECGVGFYSDDAAQTCSSCLAGHYCGSNTTTSIALSSGGGSWSKSADMSGKCFNGTYCSVKMIRAPDLDRDACPAGYYCPSGATIPLPCPAGTYSASTGQDEVTDCEPVPAGFYSISGSSSFTGMCEPGHYCPVRSTGPKQIPCPARYYLPE